MVLNKFSIHSTQSTVEGAQYSITSIYQVELLQTKYPKLTTLEQIWSELTEQLKAFVSGASREFGYLFPGHGLKGKQRVIENNDDVVGMYADYKGKRLVTL